MLALRTDKDSRRTRGLKSGALTGSFSANQRKRNRKPLESLERVDMSRGVIRLELTKSGRRGRCRSTTTRTVRWCASTKADGRVFKTHYIQTAYNNAVEAAKLDDVNFHTLRRTFASWAVMRGVTVKELQELLGHASLTMTMRYAHLAPEAPPHGGQSPGGTHQLSARLGFSARALSEPGERRRSSSSSWLPFVNTYRTLCLALSPEMRRLFVNDFGDND